MPQVGAVIVDPEWKSVATRNRVEQNMPQGCEERFNDNWDRNDAGKYLYGKDNIAIMIIIQKRKLHFYSGSHLLSKQPYLMLTRINGSIILSIPATRASEKLV